MDSGGAIMVMILCVVCVMCFATGGGLWYFNSLCKYGVGKSCSPAPSPSGGTPSPSTGGGSPSPIGAPAPSGGAPVPAGTPSPIGAPVPAPSGGVPVPAPSGVQVPAPQTTPPPPACGSGTWRNGSSCTPCTTTVPTGKYVSSACTPTSDTVFASTPTCPSDKILNNFNVGSSTSAGSGGTCEYCSYSGWDWSNQTKNCSALRGTVRRTRTIGGTDSCTLPLEQTTSLMCEECCNCPWAGGGCYYGSE